MNGAEAEDDDAGADEEEEEVLGRGGRRGAAKVSLVAQSISST